MSRLARVLPAEWVSAVGTARKLAATTKIDSSSVKIGFLIYILTFALGALVGYFAEKRFTPALLSSIITMFSIMTGFMMNLMAATGKAEGLSGLSYQEARLVISKLKFLLWTHSVTLLIFTITIILGLARYYLDTSQNELPRQISGLLFVGGLSVSLVRSFLLPYQLAEIHLSSYHWTLKTIEDRENKELDSVGPKQK